MAYERLQVSVAAPVIPSDTVDIPCPSGPSIVGVNNVPTAFTNKVTSLLPLFDNDQLKTGAIIVNNTTNAKSTITAIDDPNMCSLADNIMNLGDAFTIFLTPSSIQSRGAIIYIGDVLGGTSLTVETVGGNVVTYPLVIPGTFLPVFVKRVYDTGTTASSLIAHW